MFYSAFSYSVSIQSLVTIYRQFLLRFNSRAAIFPYNLRSTFIDNTHRCQYRSIFIRIDHNCRKGFNCVIPVRPSCKIYRFISESGRNTFCKFDSAKIQKGACVTGPPPVSVLTRSMMNSALFPLALKLLSPLGGPKVAVSPKPALLFTTSASAEFLVERITIAKVNSIEKLASSRSMIATDSLRVLTITGLDCKRLIVICFSRQIDDWSWKSLIPWSIGRCSVSFSFYINTGLNNRIKFSIDVVPINSNPSKNPTGGFVL